MTNERKNVPELRFPGFTEEWKQKNIGDYIKELKMFETQQGSGFSIATSSRKGLFKQEDYFDGERTFSKNDVSYSVVPPNFITYRHMSDDNIFKFNINSFNENLLVSKEYPVFDVNNQADKKFVFYELNNNNNFLKFCIKQKKGGTRTRLYFKVLEKYKTFFPTILEQEKIGDFFSKLDRQIELEEQKLAKLEEQKKGYMQKIFSQELRFKNENGNNYPDWEVKKIGEIMDVASVKRIHQSDWTNEGVKFIRARDIVSRYKGKIVEDPLFISKERYEEYSKLSGKVKIGDLLVTGVGTIGVPLLINNEKPIYFKDGNIIWLKNEDNIDKNFLFYSFISRKTQNFIKSVAGIGTVGTYTISNAKKTPILLPVSIEQVKIGNFFNELDKSIKKQNKKVDLLKERKKGFLQKMFI